MTDSPKSCESGANHTAKEETKDERIKRLMAEDTFFDKCMKENDITEEEKGYRRGYRHGFYAARNSPETNYQQVCEWTHSFSTEKNPGMTNPTIKK